MSAQYIVRDAPDSLGRPMIKNDVFGFIEARVNTMSVEKAEKYIIDIVVHANNILKNKKEC